MMRKIAFVLSLFLSVVFSQDKIYYKISNIKDIGILILYDDSGNSKVLSTIYSNYKDYDKNIIKNLKNGYNYLLFLLYDLPDKRKKQNLLSTVVGDTLNTTFYAGDIIINSITSIIGLKGHSRLHFDTINRWQYNFILYKNNIKISDLSDRGNSRTPFGLKKVIVYELVKFNNNIQISFKKNYSSSLYKLIKKELKQNYQKNKGLSNREEIKKIYMANIFKIVDKNMLPLLKKAITIEVKKYAKSNNLKMLKKLNSNPLINRKKLQLSINKVQLYWSNIFYSALQTRNLKKAKDIINNGLSTTSDNQDTRSIYDIVEKISKIEKKYKVKISVNLKNPKDDISIIKDGFKIGKISQIGKTIKGVCPYKKEFLANNLTDISMKIITGCIKTGDDCTKERDISKCFIVKDYKLLGYIASITKDAKKSDYLWSLYSKNGTFIDEYDTYENQKNLLKRYNKYTDEE